jgi:predicted PurR-regulated permease PerM
MVAGMATRRRAAADGSTWTRAKPLYVAAVLAIMTYLGLQLLLELQSILLMLFVSVVLAAALSRPTAMLERRGVPRGAAILLIQLGVLAMLLATAWFVVPPLVNQLASFAEHVPGYVDRFQGLRRDYAKIRARYPELGPFDQEVAKLADRVGGTVGRRLIDLPQRTSQLLFELVTVQALTTLLVLRRNRMLAALLALVSPARRDKTEQVLTKIGERIGAYVRAKVIVMAIVGSLMYVALVALSVPFAVPLAVIVAFGEVIPQIGPLIARVPLLSVAAFQGWRTLALTFAVSVILENLKAFVISPRVEGDQLKIDPLLVLIAVLVGAVLLGAAGALVAVPFAAMLQVLFDEVFVPWRLAQIEAEEGPPGAESRT